MWILVPMIHGCINVCGICTVTERRLRLAQMIWSRAHHSQGLWMCGSHHPWIICNWRWHLHMHWELHSLLIEKWVKNWSLQKCILLWLLRFLNFFTCFLLKIKNSLGNFGVDISFLLYECGLSCRTLHGSGSFHWNLSCNWSSSTRCLKILHLLHLLHLHHLLHWVELRIS